jgi:hypothetical protein
VNKRWFGLDPVDIGIHLGITVCLMGAVSISKGPAEVMPMIFAASLALLGIRRSLARRKSATNSGEFTAERIDEIEERMREVDQLQHRVLELEERLDFAERLLARQPPRAELENRASSLNS